jgi:hypothetical protein
VQKSAQTPTNARKAADSQLVRGLLLGSASPLENNAHGATSGNSINTLQGIVRTTMKTLSIISLLVAAAFIAGCSAGPNELDPRATNPAAANAGAIGGTSESTRRLALQAMFWPALFRKGAAGLRCPATVTADSGLFHSLDCVVSGM